jgi:hypothetical protein
LSLPPPCTTAACSGRGDLAAFCLDDFQQLARRASVYRGLPASNHPQMASGNDIRVLHHKGRTVARPVGVFPRMNVPPSIHSATAVHEPVIKQSQKGSFVRASWCCPPLPTRPAAPQRPPRTLELSTLLWFTNSCTIKRVSQTVVSETQQEKALQAAWVVETVLHSLARS